MSAVDLRVEDYLDDRLQSAADLETVSALLSGVELQRSQLRAQLDAAARELDAARLDSRDRRRSLSRRIGEFQALQHSIDSRVREATESDAVAAAEARLERPLGRLHSVERAIAYLDTLLGAEQWRAEARSHLPGAPGAALESYGRLRALAAALRERQAAADGAAEHLVRHVEAAAAALREEMRATMTDELEAILRERRWPGGVDPEAGEMDEQWLACCGRLLDLQAPVMDEATLLPVDAMARIFAAEFRYHFLSDRPTSRPQALGTACLPWWLATLDRWEGFFRRNLGPALAARFADDGAGAAGAGYADPACALAASLLPVLREKVAAVLAAVAVAGGAPGGPGSPGLLLSGLVGELLGFDDEVRSRLGDHDHGGYPAEGLGGEVLAQADHFDRWFEAEREFSLERYRTIVTAADGAVIDYDYAGGRTKPTRAAVRIGDLLRGVTDRYRRVRRLGHRTRFLVGIQVEILDLYHDRLRAGLEAYRSLTSAVVGTLLLHGGGEAAREQQQQQLGGLGGTGALERLCRVLGSADHVVGMLREWGDQEFFVVLWDEIQRRDRDRARSAADGDDSKDQNQKVGGSGEGMIFDETAGAYAARRRDAETLITAALNDMHARALRPYVARVGWTTTAVPDDDEDTLSITPELDEPLRVMRRNLDFLSRALGPAPFRRVVRPALERIHSQLWAEVLMRHRFTRAGAARLRRDVAALETLAERHVPGGMAAAAMRSLAEALVLLTLPVDHADEGDGGDGEAGSRWTLGRASDAVFADNARAREVLDALGLVRLTPANARNILQRRVENGE